MKTGIIKYENGNYLIQHKLSYSDGFSGIITYNIDIPIVKIQCEFIKSKDIIGKEVEFEYINEFEVEISNYYL